MSVYEPNSFLLQAGFLNINNFDEAIIQSVLSRPRRRVPIVSPETSYVRNRFSPFIAPQTTVNVGFGLACSAVNLERAGLKIAARKLGLNFDAGKGSMGLAPEQSRDSLPEATRKPHRGREPCRRSESC
jgi:hypothetical protein